MASIGEGPGVVNIQGGLQSLGIHICDDNFY